MTILVSASLFFGNYLGAIFGAKQCLNEFSEFPTELGKESR